MLLISFSGVLFHTSIHDLKLARGLTVHPRQQRSLRTDRSFRPSPTSVIKLYQIPSPCFGREIIAKSSCLLSASSSADSDADDELESLLSSNSTREDDDYAKESSQSNSTKLNEDDGEVGSPSCNVTKIQPASIKDTSTGTDKGESKLLAASDGPRRQFNPFRRKGPKGIAISKGRRDLSMSSKEDRPTREKTSKDSFERDQHVVPKKKKRRRKESIPDVKRSQQAVAGQQKQQHKWKVRKRIVQLLTLAAALLVASP